MGSLRGFSEIGALVRQRRFLVAGIALAVLLVALLTTFFVPRQYESETTVRLLDSAALQAAYGRPAVGGTHRQAVIGRFREDLTTREAVLGALEDTDLDARLAGLSPAEKAAEREAMVTAVREGTSMEERTGEAGEFLFRVSLRGRDPELALRVLTRLVTGYQKRKFEDRGLGASAAYTKVRDALTATEKAHAAAGKELEEFTAAHREHRFGEATDTAGRLGREKAELAGVDREIEALDTRLTDVRGQLAEEGEWREAEEGEESTDGRVKNEVWQDLRSSERAIVSEIAVKKRIRKTHAKRVDELSELLRTFPELQAKWKELVRAEADLSTRKEELAAEETKAREAWQERAAEGALVFDVLDAPGQPGGPAGSGRFVVSLVGLVLGLCGGVGSVVVMGITDKSYHRSDEVAAALSIPVLGAIARIETPIEREESKRRMRRAARAVVVLAVLVGMTVVAQLTFDETISTFVRSVVSLQVR
ncbi:MAG: hypothetical protein ABFS86_06610 [Planctomycetota bacterium]